jgi:hypothetical protein
MIWTKSLKNLILGQVQKQEFCSVSITVCKTMHFCLHEKRLPIFQLQMQGRCVRNHPISIKSLSHKFDPKSCKAIRVLTKLIVSQTNTRERDRETERQRQRETERERETERDREREYN